MRASCEAGQYRRQLAANRGTKKNAPMLCGIGALVCEPDNVLLSREIHPTIIGAESFHCPVRDGKEWFQLAMVVRQNRRLLEQPPQKQQPSRNPIGRSKGYIAVAIVLAFAPQLTEEAARL